jgi:hypothetical protein
VSTSPHWPISRAVTGVDLHVMVSSTENVSAVAMRLLRSGVPLTLLLDLAAGPHSRELFLDEPSNLDWLPRPRQEITPAG